LLTPVVVAAEPLTVTVVAPETKFVPLTVTLPLVPAVLLVGLKLVIVGGSGKTTVEPR
jgi:hypothetical protein